MNDSHLSDRMFQVIDALSSGVNLTEAAAAAGVQPKIGRNQPCPCGSGKKYKRCCLGKPLTAAA
ncbi:MAG: SEC-C metal-binding domain-containing protein [Bryobacteraceae bacterium]|jgi:uncharacterized protein YecA (UPF0149 family)